MAKATSGWATSSGSLVDFNSSVENVPLGIPVLDGLPGNYFGSAFRTKSGELIFGSTTAITTFYPDRLADNPYVPPVVLTDILLSSAPVRQEPDAAAPPNQ